MSVLLDVFYIRHHHKRSLSLSLISLVYIQISFFLRIILLIKQLASLGKKAALKDRIWME